jgi:26S proteasome regulatory subunit N2
MFARCFAEGEYKQALGVALESRRLDKIREAIDSSGSVPEMLTYGFEVCKSLVTSRDFRHTVCFCFPFLLLLFLFLIKNIDQILLLKQ